MAAAAVCVSSWPAQALHHHQQASGWCPVPPVWRNAGPQDETDVECTKHINMPVKLQGEWPKEWPKEWRHKRVHVRLALGVLEGPALDPTQAAQWLDASPENFMDLSTGECHVRFTIKAVSTSISDRAFVVTASVELPNGMLSATSDGIIVKSKRSRKSDRCEDALAHVRQCVKCTAALQGERSPDTHAPDAAAAAAAPTESNPAFSTPTNASASTLTPAVSTPVSATSVPVAKAKAQKRRPKRKLLSARRKKSKKAAKSSSEDGGSSDSSEEGDSSDSSDDDDDDDGEE